MLELEKFNTQQIETEQQRWLRFFKDGDHLNDEKLPNWMTTHEMRQAMSWLNTIWIDNYLTDVTQTLCFLTQKSDYLWKRIL